MFFHYFFFFFNDTATTELYPLSLPAAFPIYQQQIGVHERREPGRREVLVDDGLHATDRVAVLDHRDTAAARGDHDVTRLRSEEHTSELQSRQYLVCRLLLEKKKNINCADKQH